MDSHRWIFVVSLFALHNVESRRQNIDMHIDIHIYTAEHNMVSL